MLRSDEVISEYRVIRNDLANSTGIGLDPGKHRRRPRAREYRIVYPIPPRFPRLAERVGNPLDCVGACRSVERGGSQPTAGSDGRDRQDAALDGAEFATEDMMTTLHPGPYSLFATPYSLLAEGASHA